MAGLSAYDIKHMNDGKGRTYTVKSGDNLAKIAKDLYGNERMMAEIIRLNGGGLRTIQPGMILKLPKFNDNQDIFISNDWAKNMGMATTDQLKEYYAAKPGGRATTDFNAAGFGWKNSSANGGSGVAGLSPLMGTGGTGTNVPMTPAQNQGPKIPEGNVKNKGMMPIPQSYQQHPTSIPPLGTGQNQGPKIPDTPALSAPQQRRYAIGNAITNFLGNRTPSYGGQYNPSGQKLGGNPLYTGNPAYGGKYNPSGQQLGGNPLYTGNPAYGGQYNPSGTNLKSPSLADVNAALTGQLPTGALPGSANPVTPKGGATQGLPAPTPDTIRIEQADKAAAKLGRIASNSGETLTKAEADLLVMDLGYVPGSPQYVELYSYVANPIGAANPAVGGLGGVTPSPDNGFWDSMNVGYYGQMPRQARYGGGGGGGGSGGNFADWSQSNGYGSYLGLTNWRGI